MVLLVSLVETKNVSLDCWLSPVASWENPNQSTCNGSGDQNITTENNSFFFRVSWTSPCGQRHLGVSIPRAMGSAGTAEKKVLPFTVFKKKCLGFLDFSLWTATSGGVNPRAMGAAGTARLRRIILFSYYSFIPTDIWKKSHSNRLATCWNVFPLCL